MKAVVDKELCISCGICTELCPDVFELGEDEKATVKVNPVPPDVADACRQAAEQCPTSAITVEEQE